MDSSRFDVCIVGGAGHVGTPLAVLLAHAGYRVLVHDLNRKAMDTMASGKLPYVEEGAEELLREALAAKRLGFSAEPSSIRDVPYVVLTIGTPVDEFQNPDLRIITRCIDALIPHMSDAQTLILRSTVFPGVTEHVQRYLAQRGKRPLIAFCPERVVQGFAIEEMRTLPQIVSGMTPEAEESASRLFTRIAPKLVPMVVMEAEFAKLFANAYRYIQFAAANQFYMMVEAAGLDYTRLLRGLKEDYPRCRDLPSPGFAGGPCLYKDTVQLAAFAKNQFGIGYAALQINEGLPAFVLSRLQARYDVSEKTVGLLGMAFKAESDDTRSSLSYKLKKLLQIVAKDVLTTDPFVTTDPELLPVEDVVARSDVLILCVPHKAFRQVSFGNKPVVDVWGFLDGRKSEAGTQPPATPASRTAPRMPAATRG
jgi:UDP-N-acetyl-D-mannosaminuronic acid dehydrogenase